jgi:hypothetical protein
MGADKSIYLARDSVDCSPRLAMQRSAASLAFNQALKEAGQSSKFPAVSAIWQNLTAMSTKRPLLKGASIVGPESVATNRGVPRLARYS